MSVRASIVVIAHNEEKYISKCLVSLLRQTCKDIEIIAVDSVSTDNTAGIIREFEAADKRVKQVRAARRGYSTARNAGLGFATGELVFFTDADCVTAQEWVENGLKEFTDNDVAGACGLTYYVSKDYKPTVRDRVVYNKKGDVYPTCNIAFRKGVLEQIGNFSLRYDVGLEDWDIAFRVLKHGKIVFAKDMMVFHQKKIKEIGSPLRSLDRIKGAVFLIKDHYGDPHLPPSYALGRVCAPWELVIAIFPPALFLYYMLSGKRVNLLKDLKFILFDYFICAARRAIILKTAIKEKVFLI